MMQQTESRETKGVDLRSVQGRVLVFTLACLASMTALSIDIMIPSMPNIATSLGTSTATVQSTLSVFVFCYGVGQLGFGPLSDRYGRRGPLIAALGLYVAASLLCAVAWEGWAFGLGRALQGFGACAAAVAFVAVSRDCFSGRTQGRVLAVSGSISSLAPFAAPLLGAELDRRFGWRSTSLALALFAVFLVLWVWMTLRESSSKASSEPLFPGYLKLLERRHFIRYTLVNTFGFCAIFAFLSTCSGLLIEVRGLDPRSFSIWIAVNAVFNTLGCLWATRLLKSSHLDAVMTLGAQLIALGGLGIACFAIWESTFAFMGPMFVLSLGVALIMPASAAAAMEPFADDTARAAGFLGFTRFTVAGIVGATLSAASSALPIGLVMFACGMGCLGLIKYPEWTSAPRVFTAATR